MKLMILSPVVLFALIVSFSACPSSPGSSSRSSTASIAGSSAAGSIISSSTPASASPSSTGSVSSSVTVSSSSIAPTHTISFNPNGGSGSMASLTIAEGNSTNLPGNTFTNIGNSFAGWASTPTGGVVFNDHQNFTMGSSNVTLYAVWTTPNSLLVHYNFSGQNCNDLSGNGNNGTGYNITYISNASGGYSASFNGTSSYISLPNSIVKNNSNFTIMIRFLATNGQAGVLFGYQNQTVGTPAPSQFMPVIVVRSDGLLYGELWIGSDLIVHSTTAVNDGLWHTVYFSATSSSISLYLDGISLGSNSGAVNSLSMIYNQIGVSDCATRAYMPNVNPTNNGWWYYDGLIGDFYFYNTALQ